MLRIFLICASVLAGFTVPVNAQQPTTADPSQNAPGDKPKPKQKPKAKAKKPAETAEVGSDKAKLLDKFRDWTVFIHEAGGSRICFAAAAPNEMQPKTAKRTPVIFYLTTWAKDGVRNEVSVKQGYTLKTGSGATVTAGGQNFTLIADDDKVFVKDTAEEKKLIAAMSGGGIVAVKATSAKGTVTTDKYSLDGLADALKKMQEACP